MSRTSCVEGQVSVVVVTVLTAVTAMATLVAAAAVTTAAAAVRAAAAAVRAAAAAVRAGRLRGAAVVIRRFGGGGRLGCCGRVVGAVTGTGVIVVRLGLAVATLVVAGLDFAVAVVVGGPRPGMTATVVSRLGLRLAAVVITWLDRARRLRGLGRLGGLGGSAVSVGSVDSVGSAFAVGSAVGALAAFVVARSSCRPGPERPSAANAAPAIRNTETTPTPTPRTNRISLRI